MRTVVTGGVGFQGSHLIDSLSAQGHFIKVLNTPSRHALDIYETVLKKKKNLRVHWGSVVDKYMTDLVIDGADVVFHFAAKVNVDDSIDDPHLFIKTNVMGTQNVLDSCLKHNVPLIYISSTEVYGGTGDKLNPASPYAASKAAADRLCHAYWRTHGMNIKIVRPANVFGPRQKSGKGGAVIPIFFDRAMAGKSLKIFGGGKQTREYIHISDLVRAYELILEDDSLDGMAINVGSGCYYSIKEIAEMIMEIVGKGYIEHVEGRKGEVKSFRLDTSLLDGLGFSPQIHMRDGLEGYYKWIQGRLDNEKNTVRRGEQSRRRSRGHPS